MKQAYLPVLLLCLVCSADAVSRNAVGSVQKVIQLMASLRAKGEKQLAEEQDTFEKYRIWVQGRQYELGNEVEDGRTKVEELGSAVTDGEASVTALTKDIADLDQDILQAKQEKTDAKKVRDVEHAEFVALQKDQLESAEALQRAITELQTPAASQEKKDALLQQITKDRGAYEPALTAYLQISNSGEDGRGGSFRKKPPGVLKLMKDLREKFREERLEADQAETAKEQEYGTFANNLDIRVKRSERQRQDKELTKVSVAADLAKAKADLAEAKDDLAEAEKFLKDVNATWKAKAATFQQNQRVRHEETEALTKAIEVMKQASSSALLSERQAPEKALYVSFLQVGQSENQRQLAAVQLRGAQGAAVKASAAGPLTKVIKMVRDLQMQKKEELLHMQEKKGWCDAEQAANEAKRNETGDAVETLSAKLEDREGQLSEMQDELSKLAEEQADLQSAVTNATDQRKREEADNKAALEEARTGQKAVEQAMDVLGSFYGRDASAALVQQGETSGQAPAMEAYSGMGSGGNGVLGMLAVIETDFNRMESEATAAEAQSKNEYNELVLDCKTGVQKKSARQEHLRRRVDEAESEVSELKDELSSSQEELKQANSYAEELKASCNGRTMTYEERQKKRQDEIDSLKEAQEALKVQAESS